MPLRRSRFVGDGSGDLSTQLMSESCERWKSLNDEERQAKLPVERERQTSVKVRVQRGARDHELPRELVEIERRSCDDFRE